MIMLRPANMPKAVRKAGRQAQHDNMKKRISRKILYVLVIGGILLVITIGFLLTSRPQPEDRLKTPAFGLGIDLADTKRLAQELNSLISDTILSGSLDHLTLLKMFPGVSSLILQDPFVLGANISFTVKGDPGLSLQLSGKLLRTGTELRYKGKGTLVNGNISLPIDILLAGEDLYFKVGETDRNNLTASQQTALDFAVNNWVHFDIGKYTTALPASLNLSFEAPQERRDELSTLWSETPIFNVKQEKDRADDLGKLPCALAKLNAAAFPGLNLSDRDFSISLCTKSATELPAVLQVAENWGTVNGWELEVSIYSTESTLSDFDIPTEFKELGEIIQ